MDNIIKILAGFEETAYKILMLVIIIPKTLLKIIFDPVGARDYIEKQLNPPENEESKTESQRTPPFTEYFSPVLLLLTVALVPALLLSFLPETGVSITSSAIQEGSTQYEFRGEAAFSSSAQGKGYEFRWEVRNQTENSVIAVIHTDTDPGKGGIQYDDNKATDIYIYDFDKEGNYLVKVTVKDPYGYVLFTDSKSVSVSPKDSKTENSTELKVNVTNPDGISFERKQLNIDSLSNVLKKDTTIFLAFSMLLPPLFFAFVYSLATKKQINEQEMRKIFYVECYYFSPLSAAIWIFYYSLFFLTEGTLDLTGAALHFVPPLLALTWFVSVETNALADESDEDNITRLSALFIVVACIIVVMVVGLIVSVSIADASIRDSVRDFVITIYLLISFGLVGIYFVNWRKARKSTIPEKKTIAKDQKTKISPRIKWIGGGALFIILCCISVVAYSVISTDLQSPSAAPVEATTPSNSEYREEFDGENIDWQQMEINGDPNNPNQVKWSIENGRANVTFTPEKDQYLSAYYIYTAETYYNVQVETKALSNKNNSNTVSLICRYNEAAGWYEFEVSKSGDYNIYQVVSENDAVTYNVLVSGSSLLVEMGRENIYTAICKGNNLSLYINKSQVATATDPDAKFKNGMIGVAVYSPESQDVNVQFDYVVISEPRSQPNLVNLGATATPTPIPLVSVTEQFDVELSRWNVFGDQEQVKVDPANNNKLDFQLIEKDGQYPAITLVNNVGSYSDVQMDVKITNNDSASYGVDLVCQISDNGWYDFYFSSDGLYTIYAYDLNEWTELASGGSSEINPGLASNTYTAKCEGNKLTILINGETVQTIQETMFNFTEGSIGFGISSLEGLPVDVSVDTLTITGAGSQSSVPDAGTSTPVPDAEVPTGETPVLQAQQYFTEEFDTIDHWTYIVVDGEKSRVTQDINPGLSIFADNSAMTFEINANNQWAYLTYDPFEYDDVRIDMHVNNRGANTNDVSLVCRYTETGWYEFNIGNDGLYTIYYAEVDSSGFVNYVPLFEGGSAAIKSGKGVNEYSAICAGNVLSLYINGEEVRVVTEAKYNLASGKIGIAVSSYDILPVSIDVDWVEISRP